MNSYPVSVSVVVPCYNCEKFLRAAIESVLGQSFQDFELILIDDGSTDKTPDILREFSEKDPRVRVLKNEVNRGICVALNKGLDAARGEFICRMDADDIAEPDRLEKQTSFMRAHPGTVVCGSHPILINEQGQETGRRCYDHDPVTIKKNRFLRSPFAHPATMIRRSVLEEHAIRYSARFPYAECYDLWMRLAPFGEFANVDAYLLRYRLTEVATKSVHCKASLWSTIRLRAHYLNREAGWKAYGMFLIEGALLLLPKRWILFLFKKQYEVK